MLELHIPQGELFDESKNEFYTVKATTLRLEHSLISISKWESKWHKRFLDKKPKTAEELMDYIKCMTINQSVDPRVYDRLSRSDIEAINAYISDPMTATTFTKKAMGNNGEAISSELIYYWMTSYNIPFECEKWHINRLMTLINICGIKNQPSKKMGKKATLKRNASLNAARRKAHHTRG